MAGTVMPYVMLQFFDDNGDPAAGYQLFSYLPGTTTKTDTYSDVALTTPNTNPIVLDSAGRATIYLDAISYKFVMAPPTDTDPPTSPIWTHDDVSAIPQLNTSLDITGTAGEDLVAGNWVYLSQGDGGRTAGRWYKADADLAYASTEAGGLGYVGTAITSGNAGLIRISGRVTGLAGLTAGSVYYVSGTAGAVTRIAPTRVRPIGVADSTTTIVFSCWAPTTVASVSLPGVVSTGAQEFGGEKTFGVQPMMEPGGIAASASYMSGVLYAAVDATGIPTVTDTETTLFTYTLTGGTFAAHTTGTNQPSIRVTWLCTFTADTDVKLMKLYFGATAMTITNLAVNLASNRAMYTAIIKRIDATNQMMYGSGIVSTAAAAVANTYHFTASAAAAEDETGDIIIKLTGQNTTDTTAASITLFDWNVEILG